MCSSMVAILVAGLRAKTSKAEETALDLREMEGEETVLIYSNDDKCLEPP